MLIYLFSRNEWSEGWKILKHSFDGHLSTFVLSNNQKRIHGGALGHLVRSSMSTNMASCSMWSSSRISSNWTSSSFRPGQSRERERERRWREAATTASPQGLFFFLFWCVFVLRVAFQGFFLQLVPTTQRSDCGRR